jgi:phage shock protein A
MQEQLNTAMTSLSATVGGDTPTLEEVRLKIEGRYAKAKSMAELSGDSLDARMLEIEQATVNTEATARLDQIRIEMGLAPAGELTPELAHDPLLEEAAALAEAEPKPSLDKGA